MDWYQGKNCLITGGSSGIGLAMSRQLAERGANVWILARDQEKLNSAITSIAAAAPKPNNGKFGVLSVDIQDEKAVTEKLSSFISQNGAPDLLVNCAGVAHPGFVVDTPMEQYHWLMDVNYFGTVRVTKAVAPEMIKKGSGTIVNIASLAALGGIIADSGYVASKFALRGFSNSLRLEMKRYGVRVVIVYPPDTDTPQLAYEDQFKPPVLTEYAKLGGAPMSPDAVAKVILNGVAHGKQAIVPGKDGKFLYILANHFGSLEYPILDYIMNQAYKAVEKNNRAQPHADSHV